MSDSTSSTPPIGANSLLENLRKFRFNKKSSLGEEKNMSSPEGTEPSDAKESDVKELLDSKDSSLEKDSPVKTEMSPEEQECTSSGNHVNGTDLGLFPSLLNFVFVFHLN